MKLWTMMTYNELDGTEVKQVIGNRMQQFLDTVPHFQRHITLPRVRVTVQIKLELWADQPAPEAVPLNDRFDVYVQREQAVETIEGFAGDRVIATLRRTFHQRHALQCGYCTPAMLITARDLILRKRTGSEREIRDGLAGNICRCTGYTNIVAAIAEAAQEIGKEAPNAQ